MPTLSPYIAEKRTGTYLEITVRAQVNKHEPEIVLYIIDSGKNFYVAETRTGIGGTIYRHKLLAVAKEKAIKLVGQKFPEGQKAFEKRATLYG